MLLPLDGGKLMRVRQARVLAESSVQHLYCIPGIPDSIALDSVAEPGWSGMSGVYTRPQSYERYIDALVAVMPNVAMACIAYDPNQTVYGVDAFMSEQQQRLTAELERRGIAVVLHHWNPTDMYSDVLRSKLKKVDTLITLRDVSTHIHADRLVNLCQEHNVFFCSSELDSVKKEQRWDTEVKAFHMQNLWLRSLLMDGTQIEHCT